MTILYKCKGCGKTWQKEDIEQVGCCPFCGGTPKKLQSLY